MTQDVDVRLPRAADAAGRVPTDTPSPTETPDPTDTPPDHPRVVARVTHDDAVSRQSSQLAPGEPVEQPVGGGVGVGAPGHDVGGQRVQAVLAASARAGRRPARAAR